MGASRWDAGRFVCMLGALAGFACGAKHDSSAAPETLHPPTSVSVVACAALEATDAADCASCCRFAGFDQSSFLNQGKCTCGPYPQSNASVCVNAGDLGCYACCQNASYSGGLAPDDACVCTAKVEPIACARAAPGHEACAICCLNRGFINVKNPDDDTDCVCEQ